MDKLNNKILNCENREVESLDIEMPTNLECAMPIMVDDDNLLNFYEGTFNSDNKELGQTLVKYEVDMEGKFVNEPTDVKFRFTYVDLDNKENTIDTIVSYEFNPVEYYDYSLRLRVEYIELLPLTVGDIFNNALKESMGDKKHA